MLQYSQERTFVGVFFNKDFCVTLWPEIFLIFFAGLEKQNNVKKTPLIPCNPVLVCPKRNDEEGGEVTSASLE